MKQHPLKFWRLSNRLTQREAGTQLGVSRWTINQIETGAYSPSWQMARKLNEKTGIPLHQLNADIFPTPQKETVNG